MGRILITVLLIVTGVPTLASAQGIVLESAGDYDALRAAKAYEAERTSETIVIDGRIDEPAWDLALADDDFYQNDPVRGAPPDERTVLRILYDDANLYIGIVCYQAGPIIIAELRRDFVPFDGDLLAVSLDTFDDDRNAFIFQTNPGGAKRDQQIAGGVRSSDWNGIYHVVSHIDEGWWSTEFAIPFKTLRFDEVREGQRWGMNIFRIIRYSNESVIWTPAPRPFGPADIFIYGSLVGLEGVTQGRNLYVKPFALAEFKPDATDDRNNFDAGFDVKYGVTSELTLDLTVNTDFSQVEVDEQQINLTRFSLFFPEKRDFFLENAGLFDVGGVTGTPAGAARRDVIPFFSRRIGLSDRGSPLPIRGGARLTGKIGGFDLGVMNIQVGSEGDRDSASYTPSDNWSIFRLRRDIMANSDVGGFFFNRDTGGSPYWNRTAGADMNLRFFQRRFNISGFALRTDTPDKQDENVAGRFNASYRDNFFTVRGGYLSVGEGFQNDFGFTRRKAIRQGDFFFGITPRPNTRLIRDVSPQVQSTYVTDRTNRVITKEHRAGFRVNFQDGANIGLDRNMRFERLDQPFPIRSDIEIPAGDHGFDDWNASFRTSGGRRVSVGGNLRIGDFWDGERRQTGANLSYRQSIYLNTAISWSRNKVELAGGDFTTDLIGLRLNFAFSPRMFFENFFQYNTDRRTVASNVRFRFIHHPLSDFYIVYTEIRGTGGNPLLDRALAIKVNNLFVF